MTPDLHGVPGRMRTSGNPTNGLLLIYRPGHERYHQPESWPAGVPQSCRDRLGSEAIITGPGGRPVLRFAELTMTPTPLQEQTFELLEARIT